ncbi:MAG: hypothetical protein HZB56_20320 [Deltaproteobacteria bacterium]|nr:hypothetical protein [Deltaproteobacteria bacterium]
MSSGRSVREPSSWSGAAIGPALLAATLLTGCGGGSAPGPMVAGNGFAPATGPGDTSGYFPHAPGDRWLFHYTSSGAGANAVEGTLTATVAAPRTVLGVSATVISQVDSAGGVGSTDEFFAASPGGVTYLGNDDPGDTITPWLVPYPRVLYPVALGTVATIDARGLPVGTDPIGNPVTLDLTQQIENQAFEPLRVAAGSFATALRQVTSISGTARDPAVGLTLPFTGSETRWFVPGVGLVKQSTATALGGESSSSIAELSGYTVGGVPRGIGSPTTALGGLSPIGGGPTSIPATGSDGAAFLAVARKVAAGPGSGWLSSWVAQRVGAGGAPLGDSVELVAPRAVFDAVTPREAAVAFDGSGYLAVLEREEDPSIAGHVASLVAVQVSALGVALGPAATVAAATDALPAATAPALAFDGSRYLLIFVRRSSDALHQVVGVFVSPATGQADGAEFPIAEAPGYQSSPAVSFDGSSYLVVWNQEPWLAQTRGVVARRVDMAGNLLGTGSIEVCRPPGGLGDRPALAFDGANHLVLWSDMTDIHANRISPAGELLDGDAASGGIAVTAAPGTSRVLPALAFFDGHYLAAWLASSSPGIYEGLFGARISPAGAVVSPGTAGMRLTPGGFRTGPALSAGANSALLTWLDPGDAPGASVGALGIHPFGR